MLGGQRVRLGRHDEVVLVEPADLVGPPGHGDSPPLGQEGRMVALLLGEGAHPGGEGERVGEGRDVEVRSSWARPSRSTSCQSGIWRLRSATSASVTRGESRRQATQRSADSVLIPPLLGSSSDPHGPRIAEWKPTPNHSGYRSQAAFSAENWTCLSDWENSTASPHAGQFQTSGRSLIGSAHIGLIPAQPVYLTIKSVLPHPAAQSPFSTTRSVALLYTLRMSVATGIPSSGKVKPAALARQRGQ